MNRPHFLTQNIINSARHHEAMAKAYKEGQEAARTEYHRGILDTIEVLKFNRYEPNTCGCPRKALNKREIAHNKEIDSLIADIRRRIGIPTLPQEDEDDMPF